MKKSDLAGRLARKQRITRAQAADQLDGVVHRILRKLKQGKSASLPGLGTLTPGERPRFETDTPARPEDSQRKKN